MINSEAELVFAIGRTTILLDGHHWLEGQRNWNLRRRCGE